MKLQAYWNNMRTGPWRRLEHHSIEGGRTSIEKLRVLFNWAFPIVGPYRLQVLGSWLLLTCLSAVSVAPVVLVKKIVEGFEQTDKNLYLYLALIVVVILLIGVFRLFATVSLSSILFRVRHDMEEKYAQQLSRMPLAYYENNDSGEISLAAFNQIPLLANSVEIVFRNFLQAGTTILALIVTLFFSDITVGLFSLVLIPFFFLGVKYFGRSTERSVQNTFTRISDLHSFILESLISVKTIRTLGIFHKRLESIEAMVDETLQEEKKTLLLTGLTQFTIEVVFASGIVGLIFILHLQYIEGRLSLATCAVAATGFIILAKEIKNIVKGIIGLRHIIGATSHLSACIAHPVDSTLEGKSEGSRTIQQISVENVHFCYSQNRPVLRDINMTFKTGEMTGIVGSSGAGKSTLVDLLLRLRTPDSGCIKIDNWMINDLSEEWLRKSISFVDQEPFLFNTTIRDNLLLANPDLQETEINAVLEAASAKDFVLDLKDGIDSFVGEGGCLISVGQKQRIALARALVGNPLVLILDEITSAIDTENEKIIIDALTNISRNKIVIVISHKQHVIDHCDKIYSLEKGIAHLIK